MNFNKVKLNRILRSFYYLVLNSNLCHLKLNEGDFLEKSNTLKQAGFAFLYHYLKDNKSLELDFSLYAGEMLQEFKSYENYKEILNQNNLKLENSLKLEEAGSKEAYLLNSEIKSFIESSPFSPFKVETESKQKSIVPQVLFHNILCLRDIIKGVADLHQKYPNSYIDELRQKVMSEEIASYQMGQLTSYLGANSESFDKIVEKLDWREERIEQWWQDNKGFILDSDIELLEKFLATINYPTEEGGRFNLTQRLAESEIRITTFNEFISRDTKLLENIESFVREFNLDCLRDDYALDYSLEANDHQKSVWAVERGELSLFKSFYDKNLISDYLIIAARENQLELIDFCLEQGASLEERSDGRCCIIAALSVRSFEAAKKLLFLMTPEQFKTRRRLFLDLWFLHYEQKGDLTPLVEKGFFPDIFIGLRTLENAQSTMEFLKGLDSKHLRIIKTFSLKSYVEFFPHYYELFEPFREVLDIGDEQLGAEADFCLTFNDVIFQQTKAHIKRHLEELKGKERPFVERDEDSSLKEDFSELYYTLEKMIHNRNDLAELLNLLQINRVDDFLGEVDPHYERQDYHNEINRFDSQENFYNAAAKNDLSFVEDCLKKGIDPNADYDTFTALMFASERGHRDMVALLLKYGANPNIPNKNGDCAINFSISGKHEEIEQLLLDHGSYNYFFKVSRTIYKILEENLENPRPEMELRREICEELVPYFKDLGIKSNSNLDYLHCSVLCNLYGAKAVRECKNLREVIDDPDFGEKVKDKSHLL